MNILILVMVSLVVSCHSRTPNDSELTASKNECTVQLGDGDHCIVPLSKIKPTQICVGMREVRTKAASVHPDNDPIPLVVGPDNHFYLIDHHHLAVAMLLNHYSNANAVILKNWRDHTLADFWNKMKEQQWVYLYDEHGVGPKNPSALPANLLGLRDDPFRSLAGAVRDKGGFKKTTIPFVEFAWANFFRKHISWSGNEAGWLPAVEQGVTLARSNAANNLPGYIP